MAAAGKLRIIAVVNSQRIASAPDIPTVAESGVVGYSADPWMGIFATMKLIAAIAVAAAVAGQDGAPQKDAPGMHIFSGRVCLFERQHEQHMNKICFYRCAGGPATITISAGRACPLRIER